MNISAAIIIIIEVATAPTLAESDCFSVRNAAGPPGY